MTDFKEEQNNEIEALESIYPEEIEGKIFNGFMQAKFHVI